MGGNLDCYYRVKRVRKRGRVYHYLTRICCSGGRCREESLGNIEKIARVIREIEWSPAVVRRPGFEPGTTGLGERSQGHPFITGFQGGRVERAPDDWKLPLPRIEEFEAYLESRGISERTLGDYLKYLRGLVHQYPGGGIPVAQIPRLCSNSWLYRLIRLVARWAWANGLISREDRDRVFELCSRPGRKSVGTAPATTWGEVVFLLDLLEAQAVRRPEVKAYRLMLEAIAWSGARLEEAAYLLKTAHSLEPVPHETSLREPGYVELGEWVRVALHYNRGRKRCEFLWLPRSLFEEIRGYRLPGDVDQHSLARAASWYIRNLKKRVKDTIPPPKMIRKLHYQLMESLGVPVDIRELIQNRYKALEDVVGLTNYSRLVEQADMWYTTKIAPAIAEKLES